MWRLSGQTRDGCLGHLLRGKLQQLNLRDSAAEVSGNLHPQGTCIRRAPATSTALKICAQVPWEKALQVL